MATQEVKLFGDSIVAEQTEKGTYIVRKGEKILSPYEYTLVRQLTPRCWKLFRPEAKRYDLIFANGAMQFGVDDAYQPERIGRKRKKKSWIAAMLKNGVGVYDDSGDFIAFLPGLVHVAVADDKFLLALLMAGSEPYVKVYAMWGDFLAEGFLGEALERAKSKIEEFGYI
jgi:hypothetical protein